MNRPQPWISGCTPAAAGRPKRTARMLLSFMLLCLSPSAHVLAQEKPVKMVIPYAAGGPTDILARMIAESMQGSLGRTIIADNRPGASGAIAYQGVARSTSDPNTIAVIDIPFLTNATLTPGTPYDQRDFSPIGMIGYAPVVLVVSGKSEITTVKDFVARARTSKREMSYGSAGNGSPPHLFMETFAAHHRVKLNHIPYKGASAALVDVVSGVVDGMFVGASAARSLINAGSLRALAVTGSQRMAALPSVPTLKESGHVDESLNFGPWWALVGPANLPQAWVAKLNEALRAALVAPAVEKNMQELGIVRTPSSPQELAKFLVEDDLRWRRITKSLGVEKM